MAVSAILAQRVLRRLGDLLCEQGKSHEGIARYDMALQIDPDHTPTLINRGCTFYELGEYRNAIADYERILEVANVRRTMLDEDNAEEHALNNLAWLLATATDEFRDGQRAVELATKACELTDYASAMNMGTLAAAYAEIGDFESAVKWSEKAIELEPDPIARERSAKHLASYRSGRPWRESGD